MSAHSASQRRGWLTALVEQMTDFVFEPVDEAVAPEPVQLEPHPVVAIVSAAPRSGATTLARLLAAELAAHVGGAAVVASGAPQRRAAPPSRAAIRLATALAGAGASVPCGRLCVVGEPLPGERFEAVLSAARYLAPVVVDVPPDGSAAGVARMADRVAVVAHASAEPALVDAVATVLGGEPVKIANRIAEPGAWAGRAQILIPDARVGARAAALGTRAHGALGAAIGALADALEARR